MLQTRILRITNTASHIWIGARDYAGFGRSHISGLSVDGEIGEAAQGCQAFADYQHF